MKYYFFVILISFVTPTENNNKQSNVKKKMSYLFEFYKPNLDLSNIPLEIQNLTSVYQILDILAKRKYKGCEAGVLYNPIQRTFYIRDPSKPKKDILDINGYINLKCKKFKSRNISFRDRFYFSKKILDKLLDDNLDSVIKEGANEFPDLNKGLEITLFPVKMYAPVAEDLYSLGKDHICYDSLKIIGIDDNNNIYLVFIANYLHRIFSCEGYDISKYLRYTSYCDEFCNEDFIYFSQELVKCRCSFGKYGKKFSDTSHNSTINMTKNLLNDENRYNFFANPIEINQKTYKIEHKSKSYHRHYFFLIVCIFTLQIFYSYYYSQNSNFTKLSVMFYMIILLIIYIPVRFKNADNFQIFFELITDIYPIIVLMYKSLRMIESNEIGYDDILKLSLIILLKSFDSILRDSMPNEIELIIRIFILGLTVFTPHDKYVNFFFHLTRIKLIYDFLSRFSYYLVDKNILTDFSVPFYIIMGRNRETFYLNDHLLFQINYANLKNYFEFLLGNWFLEALNFHRDKKMVIFLKMIRYMLSITILTLFCKLNEMSLLIDHFLTFKFDKIIHWNIDIAFIHCDIINLSENPYYNIFHLPILVSFYYSHVFLTKDAIIFFIIHASIGFLLSRVSNKKFKKRRRSLIEQMPINGIQENENLNNEIGNQN